MSSARSRLRRQPVSVASRRGRVVPVHRDGEVGYPSVVSRSPVRKTGRPQRGMRRSGFRVVDSGPCVGPAFTLVDLISNWAREHLPT
jgi:hypothetical protein